MNITAPTYNKLEQSQNSPITKQQVITLLQDREKLTMKEKIAKWAIKFFVLLAGVIAGTILGTVLTAIIPIPFVGAGIGSAAAFLAVMKVLPWIDEYYVRRATARLLQQDSINVVAQS